MFHAAHPLTVFLADDSSLMLERVTAMLTGCQMAVVGQARTPASSIKGILATRPQVVVLDVQLEGGTGLDVLRAVRSSVQDIAFIIFSNNAGPAYRKRYLAAGAAGFLDKSSQFEQLAQAVASLAPAAVA